MKNDVSLRDIVIKIITVAGTNCCMFAKAMKQIVNVMFSMFRYPCVYLACKVEEFNITITNFVTNMPQFDHREAVDLVLSQELLLMQMLYYHLTVHNPYRPVEGLLIDIKAM